MSTKKNGLSGYKNNKFRPPARISEIGEIPTPTKQNSTANQKPSSPSSNTSSPKAKLAINSNKKKFIPPAKLNLEETDPTQEEEELKETPTASTNNIKQPKLKDQPHEGNGVSQKLLKENDENIQPNINKEKKSTLNENNSTHNENNSTLNQNNSTLNENNSTLNETNSIHNENQEDKLAPSMVLDSTRPKRQVAGSKGSSKKEQNEEKGTGEKRVERRGRPKKSDVEKKSSAKEPKKTEDSTKKRQSNAVENQADQKKKKKKETEDEPSIGPSYPNSEETQSQFHWHRNSSHTAKDKATRNYLKCAEKTCKAKITISQKENGAPEKKFRFFHNHPPVDESKTHEEQMENIVKKEKKKEPKMEKKGGEFISPTKKKKVPKTPAERKFISSPVCKLYQNSPKYFVLATNDAIAEFRNQRLIYVTGPRPFQGMFLTIFGISLPIKTIYPVFWCVHEDESLETYLSVYSRMKAEFELSTPTLILTHPDPILINALSTAFCCPVGLDSFTFLDWFKITFLDHSSPSNFLENQIPLVKMIYASTEDQYKKEQEKLQSKDTESSRLFLSHLSTIEKIISQDAWLRHKRPEPYANLIDFELMLNFLNYLEITLQNIDNQFSLLEYVISLQKNQTIKSCTDYHLVKNEIEDPDPIPETEPQELSNHEISNHEISNHEISNHEISNHEISNHEISNHEISNHELSNSEISNHEISHHELSHHEMSHQPIGHHEMSHSSLGHPHIGHHELHHPQMGHHGLSHYEMRSYEEMNPLSEHTPLSPEHSPKHSHFVHTDIMTEIQNQASQRNIGTLHNMINPEMNEIHDYPGNLSQIHTFPFPTENNDHPDHDNELNHFGEFESILKKSKGEYQ